uniref:Uncharacterized protein n=2 Tax=Amphora coffeiformis TaxID=265554 RepID=A0A7S3L2S1_9STRA
MDHTQCLHNQTRHHQHAAAVVRQLQQQQQQKLRMTQQKLAHHNTNSQNNAHSSILSARAWQAYGNFSRKAKRVEANWEDYQGAAPAKRAKRLPSWVVPRTIQTTNNNNNNTADRRTSESDMTATSELTQQSVEIMHFLHQATPPGRMMTAIADDNHTHVVSLASQQQQQQQQQSRLIYHNHKSVVR